MDHTFKNSAREVSSALPVWIAVKSEDAAQCDGPSPLLPSIERIVLDNATCPSTLLRSLFNTMLTLDHEVECKLMECNITSCIEDTVRGSDTKAVAKLSCYKNKLNMIHIGKESVGLWKALRFLNIKTLGLSGHFGGSSMNHAESMSMSQSLSSLTHLSTLNIEVNDDSPCLWRFLHGLNITCLRRRGRFAGLNENNAESLSQSLSSLIHLETLDIGFQHEFTPALWKCLRCLNIKSLGVSGRGVVLNVNHAEPMSQSLSSLIHLETLERSFQHEFRPDLWKFLRSLNIKSLRLGGLEGLDVNHIESLSQSLASLTHLETLIFVNAFYAYPCLWKCLHGLNIKSLSVSGRFTGFIENHVKVLSRSLSSLTHLETLSINKSESSPILLDCLLGLNIKSLSMSGRFGGLIVNRAESMSQSLTSLTHLKSVSIEISDDSPSL